MLPASQIHCLPHAACFTHTLLTTCCLLHTYTAHHMLPASIAASAAMTRCDICTCDAGLYEGIRFAWINMTIPPSRPFHITGLRLVCQVKPQNWAGKFAAAGDDKLSRIWNLGAYTVKVNLLADQFGSILIYRGVCTAHIVCPPFSLLIRFSRRQVQLDRRRPCCPSNRHGLSRQLRLCPSEFVFHQR